MTVDGPTLTGWRQMNLTRRLDDAGEAEEPRRHFNLEKLTQRKTTIKKFYLHKLIKIL